MSARARTATIAILLALAGCGQSDPPAPDVATAQRTVVTTAESMEWILEPLADVIWDNAGTIIDAEGEHELAPTTGEAWDRVVYAAATLAEAGNLLLLPGRSAGPDWDEYARGLTVASKGALDAALQRDAQALFDAGGNIYQVCRACHNQYWAEGRRD